MKNNIVKIKSYAFAIRIVRLYQFIIVEKHEYVLSKQLLRSGTSIGTMIREAEHAESGSDFIHKLSIAQKEANESIYWLELMHETNCLSLEEFKSLHIENIEILKLLTSIIKTSKAKIKKSP